ncbi:MAG: endonuclease domain-containing protein [Bacteroidaceae bacterium]|nr:endonuclease domain-containing protein [Bacteroidaceae bacterium]
MAYKTSYPDRYGLLKEFARENRKNPTLAESVLWEQIRDEYLGVKFLRQHIIGDYIVDFLARKEGLIIEVDGSYHAEREQQEEDLIRTAYLQSMGYRVMRFTNEQVLYDTDNVIQQIKDYFEKGIILNNTNNEQ